MRRPSGGLECGPRPRAPGVRAPRPRRAGARRAGALPRRAGARRAGAPPRHPSCGRPVPDILRAGATSAGARLRVPRPRHPFRSSHMHAFVPRGRTYVTNERQRARRSAKDAAARGQLVGVRRLRGNAPPRAPRAPVTPLRSSQMYAFGPHGCTYVTNEPGAGPPSRAGRGVRGARRGRAAPPRRAAGRPPTAPTAAPRRVGCAGAPSTGRQPRPRGRGSRGAPARTRRR